MISLLLLPCDWPKQTCPNASQGCLCVREKDLCYDFICNASRAIYGPVNESCRLSFSDANCTHPLKSGPTFRAWLSASTAEENWWTWQKRGKKCCTQAETIIKPRTPLCQRGQREDKPALCLPPPLSVCLPLALCETISSNTPNAGEKERELVA